MSASNSNGSLKTMFANIQSKSKGSSSSAENVLDNININDIPDIDDVLAKPINSKSSKKLSVERIYQKKTQLEHILLRPDTYIGSVEPVTQQMWVFDEEHSRMIQRDITYVPGLYKIFDEILVNAADNKQRDPKGMTMIKIDIDPERNMIKIWNNGKGIPVVEHKTEKIFVPSMIFGHLLTSSNYDDSEKKVTGGRNGYGAKLCNIFSTKFIVETSSKDYHKSFRQIWTNNMSKAEEHKIGAEKDEDFTCVTFYPDLSKFKMEKLDKDIVDLFTRRAYDVVASSRGVKVTLNGKRLPIKNFKEYVELYIKDKTDENDQPLKVVHDVVSDRWEVAITLSDKGFQQVSFVNSVATTKGGRHVDYVTDQVIGKLLDIVKKKEKKAGVPIKPFQVKNHVWIFVNCLVENPTFDSQTKENMTLQPKSFGTTCNLSEKFITSVSKCGIVEAIQIWMRFKQQSQLDKKLTGSKCKKLRGIPKLDDANDAGTKNSIDCTLILTEGDSAKTLAVAGLGVVGRDKYGVFPLRGKVLNVREAAHKQIMENAEINNIIKILGLQYKEKYDTAEALRKLRYGRMMIMTDQDQDGSHIKGLLINFIHHNWPDLLKQNFLEEFITPIVKVSKKGHQEISLYSLPEFEEWKATTDNWHTWKVKYYKGLGTSTAKEAKEYFSDMSRHRILFKYGGADDDNAIVLAFSKKKIEERKEWLTNWMEERKRRAELNLPEIFLYGKGTKKISYNEFVNRELILFSNMDNERSIPSLVDGFKPGQRKVVFTCLKRNLVKEFKVAQLAGSVAEHSAYHHGEQSLMSTIVNLAQNFVGSNNINVLQPIGQFGTRLHGGKDAASARYIFTALSPLARHLFNINDDALLHYLRDDNVKIEPEWYIPIIPMVLVNGAEGIGTGWSTKIPNYDVREIVNNLRRMMNGDEPLPMVPSYKNFRGVIEAIDDERYVVNGEVSVIDDETIEITELPIRTWTQAYKEGVLEPMMQGTDKTPAVITDYKEYHTDTTVRFVVKMTPANLVKAEQAGLHRYFKLQSTMSISSMVLFDGAACIKRYARVEQILREFYNLRLEYYVKRKDYMEGMLAAESLKLDNQARFICEKIENRISIENKPKKELIQMLAMAKYDSDPVKAWRDSQAKLQADGEKVDEVASEHEDDGDEDTPGRDFNYILAMQLWSLSRERKEALLKLRDEKAAELRNLRKKSPTDLWKDDLNSFIVELDKVELQERDDEIITINKSSANAKGARKPTKKLMMAETKPTPTGRRVQPVIDAQLRAKVEAAAAAKKRKDQDRKDFGQLGNGEGSDGEPRPLSERIGGSVEKPKVKKPRKLKVPAPGITTVSSDSPKKTKTGSPKKGSPKKKGAKRNPWSDESELSELDSLHSDNDLPSSFGEVIPKNKAPRRAAAAKVKYTFSDDENQKSDASDEDNRIEDDSDVDASPSRPATSAVSRMAIDSDEDSMSVPPPQLPAARKKPDPKPAAKSASKSSPSSSPLKQSADTVDIDSDSDSGIPTKSSKAASGKSVAAKKKADGDSSNSDFDFDFGKPKSKKAAADPKPKKPVARKPKAAKKPAGSNDSDDEGSKAQPKPKPTARKPKAAAKKVNKAGSDSDISVDEEFGAKSKTKPAARKPTKAKRVVNSDSSDNEGFSAKPKSSASPNRKKVKKNDDDFDIGDLSDVQPRSLPGRAKATVKYTFDSDEEDED